MELKKNKSRRREYILALIVILVVLSLVLAARMLVGSVDVMELLKRVHGG